MLALVHPDGRRLELEIVQAGPAVYGHAVVRMTEITQTSTETRLGDHCDDVEEAGMDLVGEARHALRTGYEPATPRGWAFLAGTCEDLEHLLAEGRS